MKSVMLFIALTLSVNVNGSEVVVGVPDGAPVSISVDVGFDVEGLELISFDGQRLELIARSGSGTGRSVMMTVGDGTVSLVIGENGPTQPGPVIPPVIPDGHLGFTKAVHDWFQTVNPEADSDRVTHAHQQAANYAKIAAGLVSVPPAWSTVGDAFAILRADNQKVLPEGPIRDAWAVFAGRLSAKIETLWPFSMGEASEILQAIGAGLEAVK